MARPIKQPHEKRSEVLRARVTFAEKMHVEEQASAAGIDPSEYVRRRALGFMVSPAPRRADAALVSELNRIGVNLNQIARNLNSGRTERADVDVALAELRGVLSQRVAWTSTRNLAVENPEMAWRIMAATAMNASELKRQAGVKNTGRKSNQHVLHMTLSWHPDEQDELDADEMLGSAEAALLALGAADRQALIVCHDDKDHSHVHILVNRVSPEDGRMLSSSFERLKASEWAQKYEEARGQVFCHERVVNNAARKRGEYTRGKPNEPRHLFEQARQAGNDNLPNAQAKNSKQRSKDQQVGKHGRKMQERHAQEWDKLADAHKQRVAEIRQSIKAAITEQKETIRKDFRPRWMELHHEQQAELRAYEKAEDTRLGRTKNALKSINFRGLMQSGERKKAISEAFQAFADGDVRLTGIKRQLEAKSRGLAREQKQAEADAATEKKAEQRSKLQVNRQRYVTERAELLLKQQMDQAAQRTAWRTRRHQRQQAFRHERTTQPTPRSDKDAQQRAQMLESLRQRNRQATQRRSTDRDKDGKDRD
eukprot:g14118.t1